MPPAAHPTIGIMIDCATNDLAAAAAFWSEALQRPIAVHDEDGTGRYAVLAGDGPRVEVQRVTHASRMHLDIEAADVESEVGRLTSLGATVMERRKGWCVMRAPTGQAFCVIPARPR